MKALGYGRGYQYAHDQPDQIVRHAHLPDALAGRRYYQPTKNGAERATAERAERVARRRAAIRPNPIPSTAGRGGTPNVERGTRPRPVYLARLGDLGYRNHLRAVAEGL